jgi:hypothetical protein
LLAEEDRFLTGAALKWFLAEEDRFLTGAALMGR